MEVPTTRKKKSSNKTGKKNSSNERNKNGGCTEKRKITAKVPTAKLLNSSSPSSASKKKKKKQVKIVWRVPSESTIGLSLETMPWCHFTTEPLFNSLSKINANTSNRKKTNFPLILEEMIQNSQLISLLNLELDFFGRYVRLSDTEIEARRQIVNLVETLCRSTFNNNKNYKNVEEELRVVPFGSFASLDVCTYASDVDMSIWGVVDLPDNYQPTASSLPLQNQQAPQQQQEVEVKKKREERVRKWREVLAQVDLTPPMCETTVVSTTTTTNISADNQKQRSISVNSTDIIDLCSSDNEEEKKEEPLFFIDRKGEREEDQAIQASDKSCYTIMTSIEKFSTTSSITVHKKPLNNINDDEVYKADPTENGDNITDPLKSSSGHCNDVNSAADHHSMEVGFILSPQQQTQQLAASSKGPVGKIRKKVLSALYGLSSALRRHPISDKIEVRRFAKVPILAFETQIGVDGDVAIGGHNGADTSAYASSQIQRYNSFAPVVLLLKILLKQADLDKPFTGGLGSYKLYVMVAYHIERHIEHGGNDIPSEVLLSFLFRYGGCEDDDAKQSRAVTKLSPTSVFSSGGGTAEMQPVFRLEECVAVFKIAFQRVSLLFSQMVNKQPQYTDPEDDSSSSWSVLGTIICASTLDVEREDMLLRARAVKNYVTLPENRQSNASARGFSSSFYCSSRTSTTTITKDCGTFLAKTNLIKAPEANNNKRVLEEENTDDEADALMAGYGMQRGEGGTIVSAPERKATNGKRPKRSGRKERLREQNKATEASRRKLL